MKKLIKIIFLLLLAQYVFTVECGGEDDSDCTGEAGPGYICAQDSETGCYKKHISCAEATVGESNEECAVYGVDDDAKQICIKNTGEDSKCKQVELCTTIIGEGEKLLTDSDCNQYGVSKNNIKTHKCIKDSKENKCIEVYLCGLVPNPPEGEKKVDCSSYVVTDSETYECVENPGGDYACKEEKKSNNAPTTIVKVTQTTIVKVTQTLSDETTSLIKNETTSIDTTENIISTTSKTETNQTNIPSTIQESNTETSIIFLGCSKFNMATSYFTFSIHFISLLNSLFSDTLTFPVDIIYNTYLRRLEGANANCNKDDSSSEMVNYNCIVEANTGNIKQIKFEHTFTFSQGKVTLAGTTPLAKMSMKNLKEIDDKYSTLLSSNPSIYILDNSSFYGYDNYKFNISGTITGEKPKTISENKDLSLVVNIENSENEEEITKEADCTVTKINNDKYTLDCTTKDKNSFNLQSAMSIIDDKDILLVNINSSASNGNRTVLEPNTEDDVQNFKYYFKKSGGIGAGAIVGIVLACVVAFVAAITTSLCLKKSLNNVINDNTDMVNIRNIN